MEGDNLTLVDGKRMVFYRAKGGIGRLELVVIESEVVYNNQHYYSPAI
jgi:hypothetical protein